MKPSIDGCAFQHVFDVGGAGSTILHAIAQAISGLLEIVHSLVDVVFRSAAIDPAAIDRLLETAAERQRRPPSIRLNRSPIC